MNQYHQEILEKIRENKGTGHTSQPEDYTGSTHFGYGLSVPLHRKIIKEWVSEHKSLTFDKFINLLNSLFAGESMDEKTTGGKLLEYMPKLRVQINPELLDKWLDELVGWAEIDSLCQGSFTAKDLLAKWDQWEEEIHKLSRSEKISKRRASLVLLTSPVGENDDKKLSRLSFEMIDRLKDEKDILITKAISWLLRSLIKNYREEVSEYLKNNQDTLPKIAIRETTRKLETGKK